MLNIFDEIKDLLFGNKRLEAYKHFSKTQGFEFKKKVNPEVLPFEVQKMDYSKGMKKSNIKGFIYKSFQAHSINVHIYDLVSKKRHGK